MERFEIAAEARVRVQVSGKRTFDTQAFIDRANEILAEYVRLNELTDYLSPFASASGFFKRESYFLILRYKTQGRYKILQRLSRYDARELRHPEYRENPFFWGLFAIDPSLSTIGRKNHRFLSEQLLYADRHGIGPEHLIGFLYQSGSERLLRERVRLNLNDDEFHMARNQTKQLQAVEL